MSLTPQQELVLEAMKGGVWMTLGEVSRVTGVAEACVSAHLRHLRKEQFGSHIVEKRLVRAEWHRSTVWEYRIMKLVPA